MSALEIAQRHAVELQQVTGIKTDVIEDGGRICFLLYGVPLPSGLLSLEATDMLFVADGQYPLSAMDMFWTNVELVRADGSIPEKAEVIEHRLGRDWRRFSWHRNGAWNPAGNALLDHFAFVEDRWAKEAA